MPGLNPGSHRGPEMATQMSHYSLPIKAITPETLEEYAVNRLEALEDEDQPEEVLERLNSDGNEK